MSSFSGFDSLFPIRAYFCPTFKKRIRPLNSLNSLGKLPNVSVQNFAVGLVIDQRFTFQLFSDLLTRSVASDPVDGCHNCLLNDFAFDKSLQKPGDLDAVGRVFSSLLFHLSNSVEIY